MPAKSITFGLLAQRLSARNMLPRADMDAVMELPHKLVRLEANAYLIREGTYAQTCPVLISGFTFRQKLTVFGTRQILSVQIPGDLIDIQNLFLKVSDHNVQALTAITVAQIPMESLQKLVLDHPEIAKGIWANALAEASIYREWIVNIGRRDARTRVAHFICEFALRLKTAGLSEGYDFELPMTQEHLADATGLTPVHVNRVLRSLNMDGLIEREKRSIRIEKWDELAAEADFNERYLHLHDRLQTIKPVEDVG